ncbi:MAG: hypothetical protein WA060_01210 [Minisyncoccia bacterium]
MIFKNPKIQKLISLFLLIMILVPSFLFIEPRKAEAVTVMDILGGIWSGIKVALGIQGNASNAITASKAVQTWYQEILKQVLQAVARKALQEITKSTVNWINSGFHGSPLFLENPQSFFEDIAKSEVKNLVDTFGYDNLKYPFGKDFALNTINAYKRQLSDNAAYSLSKVMTDPVQLRNYQNNFNVGGWDAFLINTQYPQNNYLGFQMLATEELARRVQGTTQTAAQKVQTTLQQGMGFLSPQTCPSNPSYNNGVNEFQRPSFKPSQKYDESFCQFNIDGQPTPEEKTRCDNYNMDYQNGVATEKQDWQEENTCPGGLVSTTPGAVVSSQITNALGSNFRQSELGAAMGNSLSTIFDALLNKFIGDGLNSLASKKNPEPVVDDWSYNGLTLGSPDEGGANSSWDSGPDEEIILDKFKKQLHGKTIVTKINPETGAEETIEEIGNTGNGTYIPGDIANTETEIILLEIIPKLINNINPESLGISQLAEKLDQCIPGPDKNWEKRLKEEQGRIVNKLQKDQAGDDDLKIKAATDAVRELKFAVDSFKDWVIMRMINELPNSILYLEEISNMDGFPEKMDEAIRIKREKAQALARLKAIAGNEKAAQKTGLAAIATQPEAGSAQEKTMVLLKKQYNSIKSSVSSSITIENARSDVDSLNDKRNSIKNMATECEGQRENADWDKIGGRESKQHGQMTELAKFCSIPIVSGYSHGEIIRSDSSNQGQSFTFRNENNDEGEEGYKDLPIVNAKNIYGDITCTGICSWLGGGETDKRISADIDCNSVFRSNKTDYTHAGEDTF